VTDKQGSGDISSRRKKWAVAQVGESGEREERKRGTVPLTGGLHLSATRDGEWVRRGREQAGRR